ncbi:MAG: ExeA family protein [Candidatus Hydrothermia bacterium]|jgi:general secretion pathway protein A
MKDLKTVDLRRVITEFFGFREFPFSNTPDIDFVYESKSFIEGYASLYYVINQKLGFGLITGEVGTGKTHLIRYFLKTVPLPVEYALILNPILKSDEILKSIISDLGIKVAKSKGSVKESMDILYDFLLQKHAEGKRVVVIIDEAQDLPLKTLETIRLISNLETDDEKLIDIILCGQPEINEKLMSHALRQLNQRIWVRYQIKPLDIDEIEPYLNVRFDKSGSGRIYDPFIVGEVYNYTRGIPRLINALMERALLAAYVDDSKIVRPRHIKKAVESLNGGVI